jgi:hypothetical protein
MHVEIQEKFGKSGAGAIWPGIEVVQVCTLADVESRARIVVRAKRPGEANIYT